jgi:hypothetical protein
MDNVLSPMLVEKEDIQNMSFERPLKLPQDPDIHRKISDAMLLGNTYHTKVSIVFCDDEGLKRVNTTIWANGNRFICLKDGAWLPVDHILEIELI